MPALAAKKTGEEFRFKWHSRRRGEGEKDRERGIERHRGWTERLCRETAEVIIKTKTIVIIFSPLCRMTVCLYLLSSFKKTTKAP